MPAPNAIQVREHQQLLRRQSAYERAFAAHIRAVLRRQYNASARIIHNDGVQAYSFREDNIITPEQYEPSYRQMYRKVGSEEALQTWNRYVRPIVGQKNLIEDLAEFFAGGEDRTGRLITIWRNLMQDYVTTEILNHINNVTNTTKSRIATIIERGANEGLGSERIASLIREEARGDITINRSRLIARTETIGALNQGRLLAIRSSNLEYEKKWLPTLDNRTRDSHIEMRDSDFIPVRDNFLVGGEYLNYPGDPNGRADNIINCRCTVTLQVMRDANGRPIRRNQTPSYA